MSIKDRNFYFSFFIYRKQKNLGKKEKEKNKKRNNDKKVKNVKKK